MSDQSSIEPLTSKAVTYKALGGPESSNSWNARFRATCGR